MVAWDGALLVDKHAGVSSFGVIELLQDALMKAHGLRRRALPKIGHGGTLDPFATGLLAVCVGRGVKLARYFLGSRKSYEGVIRFGETTIPGDPTAPISERSESIPCSLEAIREMAYQMTLQPYLQLPPMHSAKKQNGRPLYELARKGIEIEREPREVRLFSFEILSYEAPRASFRVGCSSGTYVRTLAQDLARRLGSVAMLDSLRRTASGAHSLRGEQVHAMTVAEIVEATSAGRAWTELPCWIPFDRLLEGYERAEASPEEAHALLQGKQAGLPLILGRATAARPGSEASTLVAIYEGPALIAVARKDAGAWGLERVFVPEDA